MRGVITDIAAQFPNVISSLENIPSHMEGCTPFDLVNSFDYVTLDLRWASLYDELDAFESIVDRIVDVHLRGRVDADR